MKCPRWLNFLEKVVFNAGLGGKGWDQEDRLTEKWEEAKKERESISQFYKAFTWLD